MATPTNYSACVRNFSRDKIFVVNVQPAKTAKIFNLENFRLYGNLFNKLLFSMEFVTFCPSMQEHALTARASRLQLTSCTITYTITSIILYIESF